MKILRFIGSRLREPSTYAGIAAVLTQVPGFPYCSIIVGGCGLLAFFIKEAETPDQAAAQ